MAMVSTMIRQPSPTTSRLLALTFQPTRTNDTHSGYAISSLPYPFTHTPARSLLYQGLTLDPLHRPNPVSISMPNVLGVTILQNYILTCFSYTRATQHQNIMRCTSNTPLPEQWRKASCWHLLPVHGSWPGVHLKTSSNARLAKPGIKGS